MLKQHLRGLLLLSALSVTPVVADQTMTVEQIRQVMADSDRASENRDTQGIGRYLASDFYKYIDVEENSAPVTVRIGKQQYLQFIEEGWHAISAYSYKRADVVVNLAADELSGESFSTVIETLTTNGQDLISKVREYASYKLEDGRPVIATIQTYTLVGDTTPQ
jgi:hypothetical protein